MRAGRRLARRPRLSWFVVRSKSLNVPLSFPPARISLEIECLPQDTEVIEGELRHLPSIHTSDIAERVRKGHYCFVGRHSGEIIYVIWMAVGSCYSYAIDRSFTLSPTEIYGYSAYTFPSFRGNGVHTAGLGRSMQLLHDKGFALKHCFIDPKNGAAMRVTEKLGCQSMGVTGFIEIAGFRWYFHRDRGAFQALERRNYWRKM